MCSPKAMFMLVCSMMERAMTAAKTEPNVQKPARMITNGPRFFLEKNSQKYEKATGREPPTLKIKEREGIHNNRDHITTVK